MIAGKPLIAWTFDAVKKSTLIDKYYVSTEDKEIERVSKSYGVEVLKRPAKLATDNSPTIDTLMYHLENDFPEADAVILLQAPSPIRNEGRIDECIKLYLNNKNKIDTVVTGRIIREYTEYNSENNFKQRQEWNGFFWDDGGAYIMNSNLIRKGKVKSSKYLPVYTTREENIDIDDAFDFWIAEQVLLKRMKDANH